MLRGPTTHHVRVELAWSRVFSYFTHFLLMDQQWPWNTWLFSMIHSMSFMTVMMRRWWESPTWLGTCSPTLIVSQPGNFQQIPKPESPIYRALSQHPDPTGPPRSLSQAWRVHFSWGGDRVFAVNVGRSGKLSLGEMEMLCACLPCLRQKMLGTLPKFSVFQDGWRNKRKYMEPCIF